MRIPDPERALSAYAHQFSGGMRQRIAIAVALACGPRLLVADEPTTALDVTVQAGIIRLLDRLRRETGLAIVFITHDLGVLSAIADRVAVFYAGRVVEAGSRADVLGRPRHPYTRGLLDALPHPEASATPLVAVSGAPPAPRHVPSGCAIPPALPLRPGGVPDRRSAARSGERTVARLPRRPPARMIGSPPSRWTRSSSSTSGAGSAPSVPSPARASPSGRGQIVGLVGESGCGKSTLARAAVGMVAPVSGTIRFEGQEVRPLTRRARPRELARLQMVFQNPFSSLNPRRRIGDQIGGALAVLGVASRAKRRARVVELLEQVGLPAGAVRGYPHEFSGGQRQRIAIARALAPGPSVIVLDEPLASLDASAQAQIANLLVELAREFELGLLLISHDLAIVRHVADAVAVMYLGRIAEVAPTRAAVGDAAPPYTEALIGAVPRRRRRRHAAGGAARRGP